MENNIPRSSYMPLWTPAEKMIQDAVWEVEKMGADVRLTMAVTLLAQARAAVADFVDNPEPAATIQAIREATTRHTQSPEAAREFLQESGIEENNGWIDVKDSPPVGFVLIYTGNWIGVGKYDHDAEEDEPVWSDETGEYIDPEPTHWQPLPAPPKTKQ